MKFSEYAMNESLDEGIKDKLKDTAIKAGRKLGIKKAKDAETSDEKADREAKEKTALENARKSTIKALKIMKEFLEKEFSNRVRTYSSKPDERTFCLMVGIPKKFEKNNDGLYKCIGNIYKKCEQTNIYLVRRWEYDGCVYVAFSAPSNPAMIRD